MATPSSHLDDAVVAKLLRAARRAVANAYCPYSNFPVGAALLTERGEIVLGVNVESASYGLTICAERVAMVQAAARGSRRPHALVIYTPTERPVPPCGACRQFLAEFNPELPVVVVARTGARYTGRLDVLLPDAFGPADLDRS